jgi:uncharacterized protein YhaN
MASSTKNMNSQLGQKKKSDLLKDLQKAKKKEEELEGELKQAKQKVDEMKEESETFKKKMEAAEENAKKHIQDAEKQRINLVNRIRDLEKANNELKTLLSEFKRHEEAASKLPPSVMDVGKPSLPPSGLPSISADPRLVELKTFRPGLKSPTKVIPHDQPFKIQMVFDFTGVPATYLPAECHVSVYAKSIATPLRQSLTESKFAISTDKSQVSLDLDAKALQEGHYRLEVKLTLHKPIKEEMPALPLPPAFMLKGGRVHVY